MVELNFTFLAFTASFIVFIIMMKLAFFDPVRKLVSKREDDLAKKLEASKESLNKIANPGSELEDVSAIMRKARQDSQKIISSAVSQASEEKQSLINESLKSIKSKIELNMVSLQKEEKEILSNLDKEVEEIADIAISKIYSELGQTAARA